VSEAVTNCVQAAVSMHSGTTLRIDARVDVQQTPVRLPPYLRVGVVVRSSDEAIT
jgi:hypothetical protein